jgi:hypothetical protein
MATAVPVYEERRMSVGRVFQRAFATIGRNLVVVLGFALLVGAVPGLLLTYALGQFGVLSPATLASGSFGTFFGVILGSVLVGIIISTLVEAALTRVTVQSSEGRTVSFGDALGTAFSVVLPLIGLAIVAGIGIMLGMILLIVPGVILFLMWSVAAPALVVEREGVFAALTRSAELTKGARWKIFGIFLILIVGNWLISKVVGLVGLAAYSPANASGLSATNMVVSIVLGTLLNAVSGTIYPSIYVELRQWKEGTSVEALEQVFA